MQTKTNSLHLQSRTTLPIKPQKSPKQTRQNRMANKQEAITAVQGILGYTFKDPELLWLALQAAGSGVGPMDGNKKLAMMGDTVMKLIILDDLYTDGTQRGLIFQKRI